MSIRIMSLIWDSGLYEGSTLVTLLALGDWADEEGICYPSVPTLAKKSRQSDRNLQRCLSQLAEDGSIWRKFRKNERTVYRINVRKFEAISTGDKMSPPDKLSPVTNPAKVVTPLSPNTSDKASIIKPKAEKPPQATVKLFPNGNQKQPLSQSERDSWDLRRWRERMDASAPGVGVYVADKDADWLRRATDAAYSAGITIPRLQELLRPFFTADEERALIERLDPNKTFPFAASGP